VAEGWKAALLRTTRARAGDELKMASGENLTGSCTLGARQSEKVPATSFSHPLHHLLHAASLPRTLPTDPPI
jgi:hypothetical protein